MKVRLPLVCAIATILSFSSCKKTDDTKTNNLSTEITTHSDDQNRISTALDGVANDADIALESDVTFSGKLLEPQNTDVICGATTTVDTMSNPRKITINYNGLNCTATEFRTGTVILSMPSNVRWKNTGAQLTVTFANFKIKRVSDNKSITINGVQTHTNVTGGLLYQLPNLPQIVHTISSANMSLTFDDNSQRVWQVARKRTFTYNNGAVLTITGNQTIGNNSGVSEWGTNRFGHAFTSSITQALVIRQDCSGRLTSGEIKHEGFATAVAKFGLDASGNATGCPGTGVYYFRLTWTGPNGNSISNLYPY